MSAAVIAEVPPSGGYQQPKRRRRLTALRLVRLVPEGTFAAPVNYPIVANAAAIILCHNHPSGDPTPSADDRVVTSQLVSAGQLLDLPVHDHVIVGQGRYVSFAEAGLL